MTTTITFNDGYKVVYADKWGCKSNTALLKKLMPIVQAHCPHTTLRGRITKKCTICKAEVK